jgi:hypothetical protein
VQHGRIEGDLTARIDRRDSWLRGDIEAIEATTAGRRQTRPDNSAQCAGFGHRNGRRLRRHTSRWLPAPPGSAQEGGLPKFRLEPLIGRIAPMPVIVLVSPASPKQTFAGNRLTTPFMQTHLPSSDKGQQATAPAGHRAQFGRCSGYYCSRNCLVPLRSRTVTAIHQLALCLRSPAAQPWMRRPQRSCLNGESEKIV